MRKPEAKSGSIPEVGERRWLDGLFEVEAGERSTEWCHADDEFSIKTNMRPDGKVPVVELHRPGRLLTVEESVRFNIELGRFHAAEWKRLSTEVAIARQETASATERAGAFMDKVLAADRF